jgi:hypothetical protein
VCRVLFCLFVGLLRRRLRGITFVNGSYSGSTWAVLRRRMQLVAKTETFATYSIMRTCRGENQLLLESQSSTG